MLIQSSISNQNKQNFQGKIDIMPGDLSYAPAKYVRKAYSAIEEKIKDKPFDLFIRQNHGKNNVTVTAQKGKDWNRNKGLKVEALVADKADVYEAVALSLIQKYEEKMNTPKPTFTDKCKKLFNKLNQKFALLTQDD